MLSRMATFAPQASENEVVRGVRAAREAGKNRVLL